MIKLRGECLSNDRSNVKEEEEEEFSFFLFMIFQGELKRRRGKFKKGRRDGSTSSRRSVASSGVTPSAAVCRRKIMLLWLVSADNIESNNNKGRHRCFQVFSIPCSL